MKKRNLLVIMLVFMVSFFFISPSDIVKAATYTVDFESGTLNNPYSDSFMTTTQVDGTEFEVDNVEVHSGSKSFHMDHAQGWWNLTYDGYITNFTFWNKITGDGGNDWYYVYLFNSDQYSQDGGFVLADDSIIALLIAASPNGIWYYDHNGDPQEFDDLSPDYRIFHVEINETDEVFYQYHTDNSGVTGSPRNVTALQNNLSINRIYWLENTASLDVDDCTFITSGNYGSGGTEGSIYLKVYDSLTGEQMHLQGSNVNDATKEDRIWPSLESDLWTGEYDSYMSGYTITITDNWIEGSSHTLELKGFYDNNIQGYVNDISKSWWTYTATFKWYKGQTYSFTITSTDMGQAGFNNCADTHWPSDDACMDNEDYHKLCTDKDIYALGETVYLKWFFPSVSWLATHGGMTSDWELEVWDESEITWNPIINYYQESDWFAPSSCDWIYMEFVLDADYDDDYKEYKIQLVNRDPWVDYTAGEVRFWCSGESFDMTAEILYITPSEPRTFQQSSIAFTANCTTKTVIERLGSGDEPDIYYKNNPNGTGYINTTFWLPGTYVARIYGWDGVAFVPQALDSLLFNVTGEQTPWGGHEYLEIFGDPYYIAGQLGRNVTINFRTLVNDTNLTITMPNGATSWFSRTVDIHNYTHSFWLPAGVPIGQWTVTLYGQQTHINYFYVISEEGNYIEFGQNVYYDGQYFSIIIKHTHYVGVTFFKDGVAQGETWRLTPNEHSEELVPIIVPPLYAQTSVGSWRVEMWRLNEENVVRLLSADNCTVVVRPGVAPTPGDSDLGNLVQTAFPDPSVRTIIGLAICLVIAFLPFLASLKMKKVGVTINIPTILYGVCFGVGVAVSYILGFFGVEVMFFITFMLISIMAFMYLYGKKSSSSGSDA